MAEPGIFTYKVDFPAGVTGARLSLIVEDENMAGLVFEDSSLTSGQEVSVEIAPGYYDLFITLQKGPWTAGTMEKVHVYSGLESKAKFIFEDADFVMPAPLTAGTWKPVNTTAENQGTHWYAFDATSGATYVVQWEDTSSGGKEYQAQLVAVDSSSGNYLASGEAFLTLTAASSGTMYAGVSSPVSYRVRYYDVTTLSPQIAPSVQSGPYYTTLWDAVPGATGYQIHRASAEAGSYTQVGTTPNEYTTSYTDSTAASGTFWYKVRAVNGSGAGLFSAPVPVSALIPLAANTVTNGTLSSPNQVDWYSFEAAAYVTYNLQSFFNDGYSMRATAYDSSGILLNTWSYSGWPVLEVPSNQTVYIRVGQDVYGYGYTEHLGSYTLRCYDPSTLPLEFAPGYVESWIPLTGYTIKWTPVNGAASGYTIYRSTAVDGPYSPLVTGVVSTSYTDSTASSGTYWYKVEAVNASGNGPRSNLPAPVSALNPLP
jgi:hypothetical protein